MTQLATRLHCAQPPYAGAGAAAVDVAASALAALLDAVPQAWLLVAGNGTVRYVNRAAEELLRAGSELRLHDGQLIAASPGNTSRLRRAIDAARAATSQRAITLSLEADSPRQPLTLLLWSVNAARPSAESLVALFAADPSRPHYFDVALLRRLYGLTAAEARVASLIADGHTIAEIAARLHVRRSTARTHLQRVLSKTGVRRQAALVRLLLRGSAQLRVR